MPVLSDDQAAMIDALQGVVQTGENFRRTRAAGTAVDRTIWARICADGWLTLLVPRDKDGIGASASDLVALCDGIGAELAPEPIAEAAVAASLLAACDTAAAEDLLRRAIDGRATVLLARRATFPLDDAPTHGLADAGWASHVIWCDTSPAGRLRVSDAADCSAAPPRRTTDGGTALFVTPPAATARDIAEGASVGQAYLDAQDLARLAAAATLCAIARAALERTTNYLRTRQQFGVPLGTFQAIQHALATCHVANNAARALCFEAARAFGSSRQSAAALMAKAQASNAAMASVKAAVQYHGAIGFCAETDVALLFRRAHTLSAAWGAPAQCLDALAEERAASRI